MVEAKSDNFQPTLMKAILIGNINYEKMAESKQKLLEQDPELNLKMIPTDNLPAVEQDLTNINGGLKQLGFKKEDIRILEGKSQRIIKNALQDTEKQIKEEAERDGYSLVFIYYGGHGAMDNRTYCINEDGSTIELEKIVRAISCRKNSYFVVLMDCCRDDISIKTMSQFKKLNAQRGSDYHPID